MHYAEIKTCDIANGPGVRTSLFVSGCTHRCKGCFNEIAWDFNYGRDFTDDTIKEIIDSKQLGDIVNINSVENVGYWHQAHSFVTGLTLLGGEPFEHSNQQGLLPLLREVRRIYPDLSIWCFTGYLFDKDIVGRMCNEWKETKEMLQYIDGIVDGKFEEDKKDMMLQFKGSSNQRTILVKESLESGNIVLLYD